MGTYFSSFSQCFIWGKEGQGSLHFASRNTAQEGSDVCVIGFDDE